jgi:hypothetical protein
VPSIQRRVMSISQGREIPDAATECLMFAIYYSTVISMSIVECREEFGEEKPGLLQRCVGSLVFWVSFFFYRSSMSLTAFRYREGVEQALVQANFLSSRDITVLQAFVIYLVILFPQSRVEDMKWHI